VVKAIERVRNENVTNDHVYSSVELSDVMTISAMKNMRIFLIGTELELSFLKKRKVKKKIIENNPNKPASDSHLKSKLKNL
jgi:hypothetical protein